jgi:hypothetical protein
MPRIMNSRHAKSQNAEMRNAEMIEASPAKLFFGVLGIATWSVKISHHKNCRNREMSKCKIATWSFGDRNMEFQEFATCEIAKCQKGLL